MAIALVVNAAAGAPSISADAVTGSIDTSGATLLVVATVGNDAQSTPTDNKSNTWAAIAGTAQTQTIFSQVFYVKNPTVGSGHIFTCPGTNRLVGLCVAAFSGTDTSANVDQSISANVTGGASTIQAGGVTPTANNEVIVAHNAGNQLGALLIDSGYTITDKFAIDPGNHYGLGMAYLIQTSAAATDPTWTNQSAISINHASLSSYKQSGGGGGGATILRPPALTLLGVQ